MDLIKAVILGVVEGATEFIPVSSTGHLIIVGHFLGFEGPKAETFEIFIQMGAILAVLLLYGRNLFKKSVAVPIALTTVPALALGALAHSFIKTHLFNPFTVALGLAAGGAAMILLEKVLKEFPKEGLESFTARDAVLIGLFQCLALWPGVSRSGATILGAMALGYQRRTAAEYSFLAAVPVILAATALDLFKSCSILSFSDFPVFCAGFIVSFVSAVVALKFFLKVLSRHSLAGFGWYRIAVAIPILLLAA